MRARGHKPTRLSSSQDFDDGYRVAVAGDAPVKIDAPHRPSGKTGRRSRPDRGRSKLQLAPADLVRRPEHPCRKWVLTMTELTAVWRQSAMSVLAYVAAINEDGTLSFWANASLN